MDRVELNQPQDTALAEFPLREDVYIVAAPMCEFDMESEDALWKGLMFKPTRRWTNSRCIAKQFQES